MIFLQIFQQNQNKAEQNKELRGGRDETRNMLIFKAEQWIHIFYSFVCFRVFGIFHSETFKAKLTSVDIRLNCVSLEFVKRWPRRDLRRAARHPEAQPGDSGLALMEVALRAERQQCQKRNLAGWQVEAHQVLDLPFFLFSQEQFPSWPRP